MFTRRRFALVAITLSVLILVLAAVSGVLLLLARNDAQSGLSAVRAAEAEMQTAQLERAPVQHITRAEIDLRKARDAFSGAAGLLGPLRPILDRVDWLPGEGHRLTGAPIAADMARDAAAGTLLLLRGLAPAASVLQGAPHGSSRTSLVLDRLAGSRSLFIAACGQLDSARRSRRRLTAAQAGALGSSLSTLDRRLPQLRDLCRGLELLPALAGFPRARTYLVAYQDSAELRATGGFIGSAGLLTLNRGTARQQFRGTAFAQENATVPSPQPMQLYNREPFWLFRDSNWSPDFPTSARLERFFAALDLHREADGVIDITPQGAADILAAVGPLTVPEYHQVITSANVAQLADYYAHWAPNPGPAALAPGAQSKVFIAIVAQYVLARLSRLSAADWVRLAQKAGDAFQHRDILVWTSDGQAEALLRADGAAGEVSRQAGDYLYVVDTNLSFNKISPYIHVSERYSVQVRSDRWLRARLVLRFTDSAPADLATHGRGPGYGLLGGPLDYADFVRILVPNGAELIDQSGWAQPWSPGEAYGRTMFSGYLLVPWRKTETVTLDYVTPPNVFDWSAGSIYRLMIQHQPGGHPDRIRVSVTSDGATHRWSAPHPDLDWSVSTPVQPQPFHAVPLPAAPMPVVAPGQWIEPHTFLAKPGV